MQGELQTCLLECGEPSRSPSERPAYQPWDLGTGSPLRGGDGLPFAGAALLDGLAAVAGLSIDSSELHTSGDLTLRRVDELISKSEEHISMVRQLERNVDAAEGNPLEVGQVPTGDELAAELERYLRGERGNGGAPGSEA